MPFATLAEMYKGLSDLPICLLALIFGIVLSKKYKEEKTWKVFFFFLACTSALGAVAHVFAFSALAKKVVWTVLYVLLFELLRMLSSLLGRYIKEEYRYPKVLYLAEVLIFAATLFLLYKESPLDIYVFIIFAALNVLWMLKLVRENGIPLRVALFLVSGVLAGFFQALKTVIPHGVVLGHVMILLAELILFTIAIDKKLKNRD